MEYYQYYLMGVVLLPAIIFAIIAQVRVKSCFNEYNKIGSSNGKFAHEIAEDVLKSKGIEDVVVKRIGGELPDYYSDKDKVIALSGDVYDSNSLAAIGVALHEVGHAIQYSEGYKMIYLRNIMIRTSNIASVLLWPLVIIGLIFNFAVLDGGIIGNIFLWAGIGFFGISILLNLVTLPVEYNASKRAKEIISSQNILTEEEQQGVAKVLNSAALTYVASLVVSIFYLLRFLLVVFVNSRDRK